MLRSTVAALVCVAVAPLVACSDDESSSSLPSSSPSPLLLTDNPRAGLAALFAGDHPEPEDRRQARCFADQLTERVAGTALRDAGILTDDGSVVTTLPVLDEATAEAWVDAQLACVDYVEASARAFVAQSKGALDVGAFTTCLRSALSGAEISGALVQTLSGGFDSPEVRLLSTTQADCAGSATP